MTAPRGPRTAPVKLGVELIAEPMQQPADPGSADVYDVPIDDLSEWQEARKRYLSARAKLVGVIERQGWRAPEGTGVLEVIVREFAGGEHTCWDESFAPPRSVCVHCGAEDTQLEVGRHEPSCIWRLAREWVARHPLELATDQPTRDGT